MVIELPRSSVFSEKPELRPRAPTSPGQAGNELLPRETVEYLDRFIVGQTQAKRAVAKALRDRWRYQQLSP